MTRDIRVLTTHAPDDPAEQVADLADVLGAAQDRVAELEALLRAESAAGFAAARDAELDPAGETVTLDAEIWNKYRKATIAAGWAIGIPHPACPIVLQVLAPTPHEMQEG